MLSVTDVKGPSFSMTRVAQSAPPVSTLQSRSALSPTIGFAPVKRCSSTSWQMLTRLVDRFDTGEIRVRGESPPPSQSFP